MSCPTLTSNVTFAAASVTTLTLRKPEEGNSKDIDPHLILHRTRSGLVYCYKRGTPLKSMALSFKALEISDAANIETFITNSAGKLITYTDYYNSPNGTTYTGYIRNSDLRDSTLNTGTANRGFAWTLTFEIA